MAVLSAMNTSIDQSEHRNVSFEAFVALNEQQSILIIQFIFMSFYIIFYKVIYIN